VDRVKDEDGKMRPAIDIVREFAVDLLEKAAREKTPYDDIPWLRALEDRVFESWLQPQLGNVALIGASGVGKDGLIERIAVRMLRGDCPERFRNTHFWDINPGAFSAGSGLRGQSEAKMMAVIALAASGDIVFNFSEGHVLASAGASQTSGDVVQLAKPALASGAMKWVINDTPEEWDAAFGGDSAINRRFERIDLEEPSGERLEKLLRAWWQRFGSGELGDERIGDVIRLADLYATEGAQPSRSTQLLNKIVAARRSSAKAVDEGAEPVALADVEQQAIRLWHIPPEEFDPALRLQKHRELERELNENLVGQAQPKAIVLQQDRNVLARVNDPRVPRFRIVLLGPKGTGKTETGGIISRVKTGSDESRIMLSDYKSPDQVPELKRQIAAYANRNPHGVLFFDEVDKGCREAQQALLSIWDKGRLNVEYVLGGRPTTKLIRLHNMKVLVAGNSAEGLIASLLGPPEGRPVSPGFQGPDARKNEAERGPGVALSRAAASFLREGAVRRAAVADGFDPYLLDRADAIAMYAPASRAEFAEILELHLSKALREIRRHGQLDARIANQGDMARDLTEAYFQKDGSARDAIRVVSSELRAAIANARFAAESAALASGADARAIRGFLMAWASGELTMVPGSLDAPAKALPGLSCSAIFAAVP
jgi:ATP-dependent Clp protease ATP-binding subunit ClpA